MASERTQWVVCPILLPCFLPWFPLERWGFAAQSLQLQHILYYDVLRQILHSFFPLHLGLQRSAIPLRCQLWQHTGLYWWLGWFQLTLCQKISPKAFEAVAGLYRELTKPYVFCHAKKKEKILKKQTNKKKITVSYSVFLLGESLEDEKSLC